MIDIDEFICDIIKSKDREDCRIGTCYNLMGGIKFALRQQGIIYKDGSLQRLSIVEENGKNCEE